MLDITAFLNALRDGKVSFLAPLNVRPFLGEGGAVVSFTGEDSVVIPLARDGQAPQLALRLPLEPTAGRSWPVRYADLSAAVGAIQAHLPQGMTILDVDDVPGTGVALLYDWIPGETLTTRVTRARERVARDRLGDLLWPLADLGEALRVSGMVHGDIAPGNLIVRPDGSMALVDLDRMGYRDADTPVEPRRRAGYRLPRGGGSPAEEDAFALLVLMTSCGILADTNLPPDNETAPPASHPTLLFSSWDLMDLQRSRLVREVEGQLSTLSRELLDLLVTATSGQPERVPGLLREAIRRVRRFGTRPEDDHAAAPSQIGWSTVERRNEDPERTWHVEPPTEVLPSIDPWLEPPATRSRTAPAGSYWPKPEATPKPAEPTPSPRSDGPRTVAEIIDDLRHIPLTQPSTTRAALRQQRAEQRRRGVANRLQQALRANDRDELIDPAMSGALAELGESDRDDVVQVVRALSHDTISRAIASDDDGMIVAAVDETVFATDTDLDPAFRDRVRLARARERWVERVIDAVRGRDGRLCAQLLAEAPDGGEGRLPPSVLRQARRLEQEHEAVTAAQEAIRERNPGRLARSLGRLAAIRPTWVDHIEPAAVIALLGEEQIERRLVARLAARNLPDEEQWMVDLVISSGRLPEVTRLSGLTPREVDQMIHRPLAAGSA